MSRADLRVAAGIVLALVGVGLLAGIAWWWIAPQPGYRVEADGLFFLDPQPEAYVAAEGWFVVVTGVIGVAAGFTVFARFRSSGWGALLGLFVGGLAGAGAAAALGMLLGRSDPWAGQLGSLVQGPLQITAWGVVLVEAGLAIATWLLLDLLVIPPPEPTPSEPPLSEPPLSEPTDYGAPRDL